MRPLLTFVFLLLGLPVLATSTVATATVGTMRLRSDFHVSTNAGASDSNPGNAAMPVATIPKMQALVRGVRVLGSNVITATLDTDMPATNSTLRFTEADSGRDGGLILWKGNKLDGGHQVTGWTLASNGIYSAAYSGQNMRALYVRGAGESNSTRYYRASRGSAPPSTNYTVTGYSSTGGYLNGTRNVGNVEYVLNTYPFSQSVVPVVSAGASTITMHQLSHTNVHNWPSTPTNVVNVWEDFVSQTNRGTFYFDEAASTLFVVPLTNHTLATATVKVPSGVSTFATFTNTGNLVWGIGTKHAAIDLRTDGFASIAQCQYLTPEHLLTNLADYVSLPAALLFASVTNVVVTNGVHEHHDGTGLRMQDFSRNSSIIGNVVRDVGGNGIIIGDALEYRSNSVSSVIRVEQNWIKNSGVIFKGACGIQVPFATLSVFANNLIDGAPYISIAIGVGLDFDPEWNYKLGTNLYAWNWLTNNSAAMRDGGAIYNQNINHGTQIASNVIVNVTSNLQSWVTGDLGNAGIYGDQGTGGLGVHHNVMADLYFTFAWNPGVSTNVYGVNYSVRTNYFAGGGVLPSSYTAPTVQADPIASNPTIVSAAGLTGTFTNLLLTP